MSPHKPAAETASEAVPTPVTTSPTSKTPWPVVSVTLDPNELLLDADADVLYGDAPLTVRFRASPFDPDDAKDPKYVWSFGDGSPNASEQNPFHTYERPGSYTARVTVTEAGGKSGSEEFDIDVYGSSK